MGEETHWTANRDPNSRLDHFTLSGKERSLWQGWNPGGRKEGGIHMTREHLFCLEALSTFEQRAKDLSNTGSHSFAERLASEAMYPVSLRPCTTSHQAPIYPTSPRSHTFFKISTYTSWGHRQRLSSSPYQIRFRLARTMLPSSLLDLQAPPSHAMFARKLVTARNPKVVHPNFPSTSTTKTRELAPSTICSQPQYTTSVDQESNTP
jgi:hypothetical protein